MTGGAAVCAPGLRDSARRRIVTAGAARVAPARWDLTPGLPRLSRHRGGSGCEAAMPETPDPPSAPYIEARSLDGDDRYGLPLRHALLLFDVRLGLRMLNALDLDAAERRRPKALPITDLTAYLAPPRDEWRAQTARMRREDQVADRASHRDLPRLRIACFEACVTMCRRPVAEASGFAVTADGHVRQRIPAGLWSDVIGPSVGDIMAGRLTIGGVTYRDIRLRPRFPIKLADAAVIFAEIRGAVAYHRALASGAGEDAARMLDRLQSSVLALAFCGRLRALSGEGARFRDVPSADLNGTRIAFDGADVLIDRQRLRSLRLMMLDPFAAQPADQDGDVVRRSVPASGVPERAPRKPSVDYSAADAPLLEEMKTLLAANPLMKVEHAAGHLASKAVGGAQEANKTTRLAKRYRKRLAETSPENDG